MRGLIIIFCFAFAHSERLANHYRQVGSHTAVENRFRNRGSTLPATQSPYTHRVRPELNNGRSGFSADTFQSGNFATPVENSYNKVFYSYTAPEDDLKDVEAVQHLALNMRKNLRVVFIKTPENNALTNAALQLVKQNAESKTAIYVLTKRPDIADLVNQLQNIQPSLESKPEVHFVKYRTPEDAINAQQIIKNEYDLLDGTSRGVSKNIANVLDFSSKKEDLIPNYRTNIGSMNRVAVMLNSYLPPNLKQ